MKRLAAITAAFCALSISTAAVSVSAQSTDATETQTPDQQCILKGGNLSADGKCMLTAQVSLSVDYPLELAQNPLIANAIDPYIQRAKNEVLNGVVEGFIPGSAQYALDITYKTYYHGENILSLVFDFYQYTGGAHGISGSQSFVFDLANNRVLTLNDLFVEGSNPLSVIGPLVEADLTEKLADISDATWIHSGTGDNPDNYQQWALDGDTLVFYFAPYQVAAYVAGPQTVTLPLSELSSILKPEFAG